MTGTKVPVRHIRKIPRLKIPDDLDKELGEQAVQAARKRRKCPINSKGDAAILLYASAGQTVENAINHFLSQRGFEIPIAEFRDTVNPRGYLATAIKKLLKQLPSEEDTVPFTHMRRLYCYGDADSEGLDVDRRNRETLWTFKLSPSALAESLRQWLELLSELHETAGKGRPPITAQKDFVLELAEWWKREVLADLSGYPFGSKSAAKRSAGTFCNFRSNCCERNPGQEVLELGPCDPRNLGKKTLTFLPVGDVSPMWFIASTADSRDYTGCNDDQLRTSRPAFGRLCWLWCAPLLYASTGRSCHRPKPIPHL
jgi:hypothetical protein